MPSPSAPLRVVLTGSESTGKTTLATSLAQRYDAALVPEFVRAFAEQRGGVITFADHGPIARGQMALEDAALAGSPSMIVQDTDLLSTVVYCRHYFGRSPDWIEREAAARCPDLYLLCGIDWPWIGDGVRDRGDRRDEMQALFTAAVAAAAAPSVLVAGAPDERLALACAAVDRLLDDRGRGSRP